MKVLEGKTPAERNKIIAAIVLGGLAVIALSYTLSGFFFPATPVKAGAKSPTPSPTAGSTNNTAGANPADSSVLANIGWMLTTPVSYAQNAFSGDAGRNVFAFYEPPPPTPYVYVPPPVKTPPPPTPTPPPPYNLAYVTPSSVYAGSKGFRMEAVGSGFTPDARILFNGSEIATNFISDQKLTADISPGMIASQGSPQIMLRNPDGSKYSFPVMMQVQAPPTPNFEFVGLIEKKHRNNDMAMLREKTAKTETSYRLNDNVGDRFRLISISGREVVLEDRSLGFKHRLQFSDSKGSLGNSGNGGRGEILTGFGRGNQGTGLPSYMGLPNAGGNPTTMNPNPNPASGEIPGIPGNVQRYQPPTVSNSNRGQSKKDYEDDDDGPDR